MCVCFGVAHDYLCRIGFVTYLHAKDAVKAKRALNKNTKSEFHGLVRFSKTLTKNHNNTPAYVHEPCELALPRPSAILPRLDKPTLQL